MDGVVSDTQKLHAQVESEILARFGIKITPEEITRRFAGVKDTEFWNELLGGNNKNYSLEGVIREKWEKMNALQSDLIVEIPGASKLIPRLQEDGFRMAIASASRQAYVKKVIGALGFEQYFEHLIGGDMVSKGKPDPESFLLAASKLKVAPQSCLVIEDGISGMHAAKAAGMSCIGLVGDTHREYPTEFLVRDLDEITSEYIDNISRQAEERAVKDR